MGKRSCGSSKNETRGLRPSGSGPGGGRARAGGHQRWRVLALELGEKSSPGTAQQGQTAPPLSWAAAGICRAGVGAPPRGLRPLENAGRTGL